MSGDDGRDGEAGSGPDPLAELLHAQREKLLAFVRWRSAPRVGGRRDPEDVLQAAYLTARGRWADYERSGMALEAWFYRVVLNAVLDDHDFHTRRRRDVRAEAGWPDRSSVQGALGLRAADTSPSETVGRREVRERIERVLAALPPDHQQIMVLVHFAELSKERAAELLGIDGPAARQRYARARARFRSVWKARYGTAGVGG